MIRSTVEVEHSQGQPSYFSCLGSENEVGESSHGQTPVDCRTSVCPRVSSPMVNGANECRIQSSQESESSKTKDMRLRDFIVVESDCLSTPTEGRLSSSLPLVLFCDEASSGLSPISCEPIQSVDFLQKQGLDFEVEEERSKWLDLQYRRFSKQVGVSIVGFENQCYSLLRRIDDERKKKIKVNDTRQPSVFGKKCARELKNLTSLVNYDRKQICF